MTTAILTRAYTKGQKRRRAKRAAITAPPIVEIERAQSIRTSALDLIEPENLRWFVLQCAPRKEAVAIRVLDLQGVPAAIPTQQRERIRRGRLLKWREPIMPGYVLVGFPGAGEIPWYDTVLRFKIITKVINEKGEPKQAPWRTSYHRDGVLVRGGIEELLPDLDAIRRGAAKYVRLWERFAKDEVVRIDAAGPFQGFEGKFMEASEIGAWVSLTIFGRETPVRVAVDGIVKAA